MGTFSAGTLYALHVTQEFSVLRWALMLFAVLFVDMGTTGFNSYFDFISGTDKASLNYEKDKVLVHEGVSPISALLISVSLFAFAGILGIILASVTSFYLIAAGAISMGVGFLYTGGPFPISRTPSGELFAGTFLGTVLFTLSYYVQTLSISYQAVIVSVSYLLLIAMILTVNNTCDKKADIEAGRKTLTICISGRVNLVLLNLQMYGAYILMIFLSFTSIVPQIVALTTAAALIPAHLTFTNMKRRGFSLKTKGSSMKSVSSLFLYFFASFCTGIIIDLLLFK